MTTTTDMKVIWYKRNSLGVVFRDIDAYLVKDNLPKRLLSEFHHTAIGTSALVFEENIKEAMTTLENKGYRVFMH